MYELRPEYAGRLLECPSCGRHIRAGYLASAPRPPAPGVDPAFDRDVFLLRERHFTMGGPVEDRRLRTLAPRMNSCRIVTVTKAQSAKHNPTGQNGTPILYVERPTYPVRTLFAYFVALIASLTAARWILGPFPEDGGGGLLVLVGFPLVAFVFLVVSMSLRPRRHVTIYRDDSRRETLLRVLQNQRVAVLTRTYTVITPSGEPLATLRKTYLHNIVRKRWYVATPGGEPIAMAIEDSIVLSLLRRVLGVFLGFLRTNFLLVRGSEEAVLGEFNRKFTLFDRYVLDLSADPDRAFDRRVALALGVMLDTGERR